MSGERERHALLIGCTGMLAEAARSLMTRYDVVTAVASTADSLARLRGSTTPETRYNPIQADWSRPEQFIGTIVEHLRSQTLPMFALVWIHRDEVAIDLFHRVFALLDERFPDVISPTVAVHPFPEGPPPTIDLYHVLGSSIADLGELAVTLRKRLRVPQTVSYHQVVLGARATPGGRRWLTHQEISNGVLEAIRNRKPVFRVGE